MTVSVVVMTMTCSAVVAVIAGLLQVTEMARHNKVIDNVLS
jgi:hypothetical protein